MRTLSIPLIATLALSAGCNTFTTVDEACLDSLPGEQYVTKAADQSLISRMNCYRRVAKRPKAVVNKQVQDAVEAHGAWIELNAPEPRALRNQTAGTEGFTGNTSMSRLEAAGYIFPTNSSLLELYTYEPGDWAGLYTEAELFDFWFDDPFHRPGFLQSVVTGVGATHGLYELEYSEESQIPNLPVSYQVWNIIYQTPAQAYAEAPVSYPRNGQVGVPPVYTHVSGNQELENGRTYGYPITFTVGSTETGLKVTQASLRDASGTELPFVLLDGDKAITALRLRNTAIIVPEAPLVAGQTYLVSVRIKTDQGERRASTSFTTGTESRFIPAAALARSIEDGVPLFGSRVRSLDGLGD